MTSFAVFVLCAAAGTAQLADGNARSELERGLSLQKQGKYDEAIQVFQTALSRGGDPSVLAEIEFELAETYFRKGQAVLEGEIEKEEPDPLLGEAAKRFAEVARKYRSMTDRAALAAYMTGSSYLLLGDMAKALEWYERAYKDFPSSKHRPKALARIGVCQAGLGDADKAREVFRRFLRLFPDDPSARKVRKYLYQLGLVGKKAPSIPTREWLYGVTPNGIEDLRGEVIVLVFFATWCENCHRELPHLRREIKYWTPRGVVFIGVADPEDPKNESPVDFYVRKNRLEFLDVALDRGSRSWRGYHVTGLPAAVIIDRKGVIRWRGHLAFLSHTLLEKLLTE